jgi:Tol biopolymer transport system component
LAGWQRARGRALAGLAALILAPSLALWWRGQPTEPRPHQVGATHKQVTFSGDVQLAALSPDGRTIAYVTGERGTAMRVLVRDVAGGQALEIGKVTSSYDITWLPDGSHVVLSAGDGKDWRIWLIPRFGGPPRRLRAYGAVLSVSPDGSRIAAASQATVGFRVISIDGNAPLMAKLGGFRWLSQVKWSPVADRVAVLTGTDNWESVIWTARPDGQDQRQIHLDKEEVWTIVWSPTGDSLYFVRRRDDANELLRVDTSSTPQGPAQVLLTGFPSVKDGTHATVSKDGRQMLYVRDTSYSNLWRVDLLRPGTVPAAVTQGTSMIWNPAVSPDGQWMAASRGVPGRVVRIPITGGEPVALTDGNKPVVSPDGRRLAFASRRSGVPRVWVSDVDGQRGTEVPDSTIVNSNVTWLPDGRLAWQSPEWSSHGQLNYRIRDLKSGHEEALLLDRSLLPVFTPRFSPGNDQVAVYSNADRAAGLWAISWPSRQARFLAPGEIHPIGWSADGRWIYASEKQAVVRVSASTGEVKPIATIPVGRIGGCDLTPDRESIICNAWESKSDAWLVEDFDPAFASSVTTTSGRSSKLF